MDGARTEAFAFVARRSVLGATGILGQPRYMSGLKNKARKVLLPGAFQAIFLEPDSVAIADLAY